MKPQTKKNPNAAGLLAVLLLVPSASHAAQMAYEGFDYATGSSNLTGMSGGSGWAAAWQTVNNGSADVIGGSLTAGSSSATGYDARSIGNSVNLPNNRRVGRFLDTSSGGPFSLRGYRDGNGYVGKDGTTIYISFMQQPNDVSAYYEFEFHRGDLGDGGRIGGIGNDSGTNNVNLRAPNNTQSAIGAGTAGVNFYVVRIDFKPGNDDVYVYRNPTSATEPGVPTLTKLAVADMSFNGISFGAFNNSRTVAHDEVRLGQTWSDVTLPVNAAPTIVSQPRASTTALAGGAVSLTAAANGFPEPTYQWYKGSTPLSGQTGTSLVLTNLQAGDAGAYHLVATNSVNSATSSDATLVVNATPAGLLAYEGFDYDTGSTNLNSKAGGLGWGAPWTNVNGGGGNVVSGSLAAGTNAPNGYDAHSQGNSDMTPNNQRDGRVLDTSPGGRLGTAGYIDSNGNVGADGKTLYLSFLQQPDGTSLFYEFEFHRGDLGDPGRIGGIGNDTANAIVNLRAPNNTSTFIGAGSTGVNLYVVRIDFKAGNDDVRVYQNPISGSEPASATLTVPNAADMSFNGLSLAAFVNNRTVKHDEIRLGQSWSDVMFGTSRRQLTWKGDGTSNTWNFAATNWNAGADPVAFVDGDPVTFDDTGSDTPAIAVPGNVSTASVTTTNSTKNYTIGGAGTITTSGGIIKSGSGSLTLNGSVISGAAFVVNGGNLLLNGSSTVGGGLVLNTGSGTVTLAGTSSFVGDLSASSGDQILSGNNAFSGALLANVGNQTLSGTNSFNGISSVNGNLTITGPTTVTGTGSTKVFIGNLAGANSTLAVNAGGSLTINGSLGDAFVIGRDGGSGSVTQTGGTVTYNPSNHPEFFIGASENGNTTGSYAISAGTLEMSNCRLGVALGPVTASLTQSGGNINVRQLDLGPNLTTGTGNYTMTGGVLTVGAGGITTTSGLYLISLSGGTVAAAADWASPLNMSLDGPTTVETAGHVITLSGTIGGTAGLTKTGNGTLILSGFSNSYSGATTVSGGVLAGYGTYDSTTGSASSALTVAAGATIAPGVNEAATMACTTATFASGSIFAVDINSVTGQSDLLSATGNVTITGASVAFSGLGGGVLPIGSEFSIIQAGHVTGTFTGLANNASVTIAGNTYKINYTSTEVKLTLTAANPYIAWAAAHNLDGSPGFESGFSADPDNDGLSNGLEWILGGDPLAQDGSSLVTVTENATTGLTFSFKRLEASIGNAALSVQWDADLVGPWTDVPITQAGGSAANGVTVTVNQATTPDSVIVNIPAANAAGGKLFGRLRAVMP